MTNRMIAQATRHDITCRVSMAFDLLEQGTKSLTWFKDIDVAARRAVSACGAPCWASSSAIRLSHLVSKELQDCSDRSAAVLQFFRDQA